ncbi:MAG: 16S rRNA (cytosine(1402)-N(4))-methyltransferase RsmH [Gammaproteobacteria bacterium]|nr:16S rRNA (cytosine(1402)-N(4))-methyltransferase RsmH [Gammaproteobacteria bacterium]
MNDRAGLEHEPALVQETLAGLAVSPDGLYVDATFGRGGHSRAILEALGGDGRLLALDCDPEAVREARLLERQDRRFSIEHANFRCLEQILEEKGWRGHVSGMLFDLGVSLPQLTDPLRGFSLHSDGPLDMRMNPNAGFSASDWLNDASADEIARVLRRYGEEPQARRIAQEIGRRRPISRCSELAGLVAGVKRAGKPGPHPATRTFMALRIVVNEELAALEEALPQAVRCLRAGGRLCAISFHSLEDRIVKRYVRDTSRLPPQLARLPDIPNSAHPLLRTIGRLRRPSSEERARNPQARSARLRVAERLGETAGS